MELGSQVSAAYSSPRVESGPTRAADYVTNARFSGTKAARRVAHGLRRPISQHPLAFSKGIIPRPTSQPRTPPGRLSARQLEAVFDLIDRRLPGQLTLAELARSADCSGAIQFLRGFRRTLGVTPYEYLVRRRVEAARTLLETGQANVGEAAATLGFSDQSHLVRQFRRRYGQPPSAFLRRTARSFKAPDAPGRRL